MPRREHSRIIKLRHRALAGACLVMVFALAFCQTLPVLADGLDSRSLQLANDAPSSATTYTVSFTISTNSTIGSLDIMFCSNTPLQYDGCTIPAGFDVTNSQLSSQTGLTGFTSFVAATNQLVLSRTPSTITPPLTVTLTFTNVINPNSIGPYYARVAAYSSTDATGSSVDFGGLAFAITNNLLINSVVPPYLTFCVGITIPSFDCTTASGDYINFGDLSYAHSSQAVSQMMVATNAPNGYIIQIYGVTMTSGNNIIPAMANDAVPRPGTSQFGINLRANTAPPIGNNPAGPGIGQPTVAYNEPDHYQFASNDTVVSTLNPDNYRRYTSSYVVNTSSTQAPGVYVSTITYVCAGSF
jgi:hypothetical protein